MRRALVKSRASDGNRLIEFGKNRCSIFTVYGKIPGIDILPHNRRLAFTG